MAHALFRQSFLLDTLDIGVEPIVREFMTAEGVCLKLHFPGALEIIPNRYDSECRNVVISCGIHGDETAAIELVDKLVSDIIDGYQSVNERVLFIIANPLAVKTESRFVAENLSRLFDDKPRESSKELVIADTLKLLLRSYFENTDPASRWHFDLHSAICASKYHSFTVVPKVRHPVRSRELMDFIEAAHIEAVILANAPSSTFSWYSADKYAAQSLSIELGCVAKFGANDLRRLVAFDIALRDFVARLPIEHLAKKSQTYRVSRTIVRINEDFGFLGTKLLENFTSFVHGEVFGHDGEKPLMAKNEGEAILFPNASVPVGERAALMVCRVTIRFEKGQMVYD
jgi:succinylglutamate desuccinylase